MTEFKGVKRETYRRNKLMVKKGKSGYLVGYINGEQLSTPIGHTVEQAEREMQSLRGTVDNFNDRPEAYTNGYGFISYNMRKDK